jgi:hypothetical protein
MVSMDRQSVELMRLGELVERSFHARLERIDPRVVACLAAAPARFLSAADLGAVGLLIERSYALSLRDWVIARRRPRPLRVLFGEEAE